MLHFFPFPLLSFLPPSYLVTQVNFLFVCRIFQAMLPTVPVMFSPDPITGHPCPSLDTGFTPWDYCSELFSSAADNPPPPPLADAPSSPKPVGSSSGSEEQNGGSDQNPANSNNSGSDGQNRRASEVDDRKRRRMISNRESARRSRMRKQKHLENLRNQVNRLRVENRELTNRLRLFLYHCQSVRTDNDRLRAEYRMLQLKLSDIRQILLSRQLQQQFTSAWPCNNLTMITTASTEPQIPSLITS